MAGSRWRTRATTRRRSRRRRWRHLLLAGWPDDVALTLEPGRSLVARAGVTLHTVGTVKEIEDVRTYVAVDGGMSDNIRPSLYGARYEFVLANRANEPATAPVRIVGKHCESGDVLALDAALPAGVAPGDLLATAATGAYCYALSSNYNVVPRPAIVHVPRRRRPRGRPPRVRRRPPPPPRTVARTSRDRFGVCA